jgi:hypothetical protein
MIAGGVVMLIWAYRAGRKSGVQPPKPI